jgi:hypothetical protein
MAAGLLAMTAAGVMAYRLRKIVPLSIGTSARHNLPDGPWKQKELFAEYLNTTPREKDGILIALCLYGGLFAIHRQWLIAASFLLALCAFLMTWRLRGDSVHAPGSRENRPHAGLRLARDTSTAVLVTTGLLLLELSHGVSSSATNYFAHDRTPSRHNGLQHDKESDRAAPDFLGYQRIILWPVPEKKKIVVSAPSRTSPRGFNISKPVTIRFDGSYWYFQPRGNSLGTRAHIARGNPLTVNIRSTNHIPLIMEAHQSLAAEVPLACCREIQVAIENQDNAPGAIALGVLLTDTTAIGKPTLYLGPQTLVSTQPGQFTVKTSPVSEILSFRVINQSKIEQFDEITVVFFPDSERPYTGAKIAIKQFDLIPR